MGNLQTYFVCECGSIIIYNAIIIIFGVIHNFLLIPCFVACCRVFLLSKLMCQLIIEGSWARPKRRVQQKCRIPNDAFPLWGGGVGWVGGDFCWATKVMLGIVRISCTDLCSVISCLLVARTSGSIWRLP